MSTDSQTTTGESDTPALEPFAGTLKELPESEAKWRLLFWDLVDEVVISRGGQGPSTKRCLHLPPEAFPSEERDGWVDHTDDVTPYCHKVVTSQHGHITKDISVYPITDDGDSWSPVCTNCMASFKLYIAEGETLRWTDGESALPPRLLPGE